MPSKKKKTMQVIDHNFKFDKTFKVVIEFSTKREALEITNLTFDQYYSLKHNIWVRGVVVYNNVNTCEIISPLQIKSVFVMVQDMGEIKKPD